MGKESKPSPSLPQVNDIFIKVGGSRDLSVKVLNYVVMRLLYRMVSYAVGDPRMSKSCYPTRQNIPSRSFRGKNEVEWVRGE